jgi:hypothetical protein
MGTYLLSGTMMRLALQQGYHRDPSHFPNLSVFQCEMRRRIWSAVSQHDLLFSIQIGLPKCIRYAECDTQSPRNLHEAELYEDMKELPPSRPVSEDSEICYQVVKLQIMRAYGYVTEFLNLLEPQPYEEVLKLDLKLMEARANIPPHLQLRTLEEMANDPPYRVMERYIMQLFYHKVKTPSLSEYFPLLCVNSRVCGNSQQLLEYSTPGNNKRIILTLVSWGIGYLPSS